MEERYDLDLDEMALRFKELQRQWHPDRARGEAEEAARRSAMINSAYQTLRKRHKRAKYMLEMAGAGLEEEDDMAASDPEFLEFVLETRQAVDDGDHETLRAMLQGNAEKMDALNEPLAKAFAERNYSEARRLTSILVFLHRIHATIEERLPHR